jgi:hypothetical protein
VILSIPVVPGILEEGVLLACLYRPGKARFWLRRLLNYRSIRILRYGSFFMGRGSAVSCRRTWWGRNGECCRCGSRRAYNPGFRERLEAKVGKIAAANGFKGTSLLLGTSCWKMVLVVSAIFLGTRVVSAFTGLGRDMGTTLRCRFNVLSTYRKYTSLRR